MIRVDLDLTSESVGDGVPPSLPKHLGAKRTTAKAPESQAFAPPEPVPFWTGPSGRAGEGAPLFAASASLALLDALLRRDPPAAGALGQRFALHSAAASAKILRLNTGAQIEIELPEFRVTADRDERGHVMARRLAIASSASFSAECCYRRLIRFYFNSSGIPSAWLRRLYYPAWKRDGAMR